MLRLRRSLRDYLCGLGWHKWEYLDVDMDKWHYTLCRCSNHCERYSEWTSVDAFEHEDYEYE